MMPAISSDQADARPGCSRFRCLGARLLDVGHRCSLLLDDTCGYAAMRLAAARITRSATARAVRSAAMTASTESAEFPSCRESTSERTSAIAIQGISPARNDATATSLAAFSQAGAVPPIRPAS